jgi:predicted DNA-binding helix-hairpin-helix protein
MNFLRERIAGYKAERRSLKKAPTFSPGGQSTQLVIGATPETDQQVLQLADNLYQDQKLKRVYYSGYVPISTDARVPQVDRTPLVRENRLYQADWLLRFYGFKVQEIVDDAHPQLDQEVDPKLAYALRNPEHFPIDVNTADYEWILRVPGIGQKSAGKIISSRRFGKLRREHLRKMGVVWKRAKYFVLTADRDYLHLGYDPDIIRHQVLHGAKQKKMTNQLDLFATPQPLLA